MLEMDTRLNLRCEKALAILAPRPRQTHRLHQTPPKLVPETTQAPSRPLPPGSPSQLINFNELRVALCCRRCPVWEDFSPGGSRRRPAALLGPEIDPPTPASGQRQPSVDARDASSGPASAAARCRQAFGSQLRSKPAKGQRAVRVEALNDRRKVSSASAGEAEIVVHNVQRSQ